ncbi:MAG: hypothetical protein ACJ746_24410 [Bryobacteraceae bacterium]
MAIVLDPIDTVASAPPSQWAVKELELALTDAGGRVRRCERVEEVKQDETPVIIAGFSAPNVATANVLPDGTKAPEALALFEREVSGRKALVAGGADPRGLSYAVCELAERVRHSTSSDAALQITRSIFERPANATRSIMRQFTSELYDKAWFYDKEQWNQYLSMLASQRFNRFDLAFGLGYDSLNQVTDSYLLFAYPFLLAVPGYDVRATNLPDAERDRNLDTLRYVSEQTAARGIDFQLGLWMHGYQWPKTPRVRYMIEGLTKENHAAYCRDALTAVLKACPAISSVGLRIHGESGIAEGSYDFWNTIFTGVGKCGRTVEIDLHAKGIDERMIGNALATGMPVNIAPKFSAEHQGMPYQQASIREKEMPVAGHSGAGLMSISEGSRVFTRSSYADLLRDDRKYTVRYRMFSGTQRILLWNDPLWTAAYSRSFAFCGSNGMDLMEPLTCRGRRGSAQPGRRSGYLDATLEPRWDWQKYIGWYRTWGRLCYNPDGDPEVCSRSYVRNPSGQALQSALAAAARILPLVTTAYLPSVACDGYWPEIHWNQAMIDTGEQSPYSGDTLPPKVFQNASPVDPQLFLTMAETASQCLRGEESGKYSMLEVAQWLDEYAEEVNAHMAQVAQPTSPAMRRGAIDARMQAGLGQFFAAKFRSGVLFGLHEQTGDLRSLEEALKAYRAARAHWVRVVDLARGVYALDLSASDRFSERGQWSDRLEGIDADIKRLESKRQSAKQTEDSRVEAAVMQILAKPVRESAQCRHESPTGFRRTEPVRLSLEVDRKDLASVRLYYRHVNQAERYQTAEMTLKGTAYAAEIPQAYLDSPYPLQYYFALQSSAKKAWLYPGFNRERTNQPYFILRAL